MKEAAMHSTKLVALIAMSMFWTSGQAGEFNKVLSIGDMAPAWKDLPGTDGKSHSLSELKDKDAVVVVFTSASCEYCVDNEDRFNALARQYGGPNGKVGFVGICVNQVAADRLDKLTERAKKKKFEYPVLYDESQKIARDFGAIWTPEYYVLNKERKIVYMGAMDDANDPAMVTKRFLEDAIVATLKGESPSVKETGARGCMVRWARERR